MHETEVDKSGLTNFKEQGPSSEAETLRKPINVSHL